MDIFDGNYYKNSKRFLEICGLWPYQTPCSRQIRQIIFYVVNLTLYIPQLILLCQLWGKDFAVTFENTVSIMFTTAVCGKYFAGFASKAQLSLLLEQIAKDWKRLNDPTEREILAKNTSVGLFYSLGYTYYLLLAWVLYTIMPSIPVALDILMPLNESRPVLTPFYANYVFFDQMDYHWWTCGHIAIVYLAGFFMFSGVDTIFVISVKHTCGLFEILSYRLKHLVPVEGTKGQLRKMNNSRVVKENLNRAIELHNDTIKCFELLEDSFNFSFLLVNCLCVVGLAILCVYIVFIYADIYKSTRIIAFMIGIVVHLLYLNLVGQQMIDASEEIFLSAYSSAWYEISNEGRKSINLIMVRSLTPCILTAGKLTYLSMENFGLLMKSTASYFTVFLSVSE